jgi:hypothetical protein
VITGSNKPHVVVAALTHLPSRSRTPERNNDSASSSNTLNSRNAAVASKPPSAAKPDNTERSQPEIRATPSTGVIKAEKAPQSSIIRTAEVVQPKLNQPPVQKTSLATTAVEKDAIPAMVAGFEAQELDFTWPMPAMPTTPDILTNPVASLDSSNTATESLDWEDHMYAAIGELLQSPVTYQVLTGASSVVFLVKTLVPGWLPTFQVPGSLPNTPPTRLPTAPGSVVSGRTSWSRWFFRV